mmetsp:Transcript_102081/g.263933  ORF Transcript_102081/g.263933 Transcript_102081/m.263933 type:complete len:226 (+) Transcript_102081:502-1179(+)
MASARRSTCTAPGKPLGEGSSSSSSSSYSSSSSSSSSSLSNPGCPIVSGRPLGANRCAPCASYGIGGGGHRPLACPNWPWPGRGSFSLGDASKCRLKLSFLTPPSFLASGVEGTGTRAGSSFNGDAGDELKEAAESSVAPMEYSCTKLSAEGRRSGVRPRIVSLMKTGAGQADALPGPAAITKKGPKLKSSLPGRAELGSTIAAWGPCVEGEGQAKDICRVWSEA